MHMHMYITLDIFYIFTSKKHNNTLNICVCRWCERSLSLAENLLTNMIVSNRKPQINTVKAHQKHFQTVFFCLSDQFGSAFTRQAGIKVWHPLLWLLGNPSEWFPSVMGPKDPGHLALNADALNGTKAHEYHLFAARIL